MDHIVNFIRSEEYPVLHKKVQIRVRGKKDMSIQANLKRMREAERREANKNLLKYIPPRRKNLF